MWVSLLEGTIHPATKLSPYTRAVIPGVGGAHTGPLKYSPMGGGDMVRGWRAEQGRWSVGDQALAWLPQCRVPGCAQKPLRSSRCRF